MKLYSNFPSEIFHWPRTNLQCTKHEIIKSIENKMEKSFHISSRELFE